MKKTINKPEVKVVKLQKMNVIATSGGVDSGNVGATFSKAKAYNVVGKWGDN